MKERYKGPRTKYYVLKNFSSTAEVFLKLLEESLQRQARNPYLDHHPSPHPHPTLYEESLQRQANAEPSPGCLCKLSSPLL